MQMKQKLFFSEYLMRNISIRDTNIKKKMKENFYHGYLLGLLNAVSNSAVSNRESGNGFADIISKSPIKRIGVILEIKYAENEKLDEHCNEAIKRIRDRHYEQTLIDDGMDVIILFGVACYKKRCKMKCEKLI